LSEETYDDLELSVTLDEESAAKMPLKEAMRTTGVKRIREACAGFVAELKVSARGCRTAGVHFRPSHGTATGQP
jgi:hypothetical protein